jgi:AraC-like DNA-binding protein
VAGEQAHSFHGLEIAVRSLSGARGLRIVHPAGQRIPEHRHDWPLLTIPALGGYEEECEDGSVAVAGPAAVLHPPGRCHANCIHARGMETFSIEFDPAWLGCAGAGAALDRSYYWIGGRVALAARSLARLWSSESSTDELRRATAAFVRMARSQRAAAAPSWFAKVQRALQAGAAPTARVVASALDMHPRWLAHAYRETAGEGLHDTIVRHRVEGAVELLRSTDQPIADIAVEAGFCDQSHLNRTLRRWTGRSPLEIRAERLPLAALAAQACSATDAPC